MGLRTLAREVAHNASYRMVGSNDMFYTNFHTLWIGPKRKKKQTKRWKNIVERMAGKV